METPLPIAADAPLDMDQRVYLRDVRWAQFEALLQIRGDRAGVRLAYRDGVVELMTPSTSHEKIKTLIARLLEAWAEEKGLELNGVGSWTVKDEEKELGLEPDECYVIGDRDPPRPDLAIEVMWTESGLSKLEIYRGLGVPEVWLWRRGAIEVHVLTGDQYELRPRSTLLPELDLELMRRYLDVRQQTKSVREYRAALRREAV